MKLILNEDDTQELTPEEEEKLKLRKLQADAEKQSKEDAYNVVRGTEKVTPRDIKLAFDKNSKKGLKMLIDFYANMSDNGKSVSVEPEDNTKGNDSGNKPTDQYNSKSDNLGSEFSNPNNAHNQSVLDAQKNITDYRVR